MTPEQLDALTRYVIWAAMFVHNPTRFNNDEVAAAEQRLRELFLKPTEETK